MGAGVSFPFFTGPRAVEHAIEYACESVAQRGAEIRLLARDGQIVSAMGFAKKVSTPITMESSIPSRAPIPPSRTSIRTRSELRPQ